MNLLPFIRPVLLLLISATVTPNSAKKIKQNSKPVIVYPNPDAEVLQTHNNPCTGHTDEIQEKDCVTSMTGLICSKTSMKCECPLKLVMDGSSRTADMEWDSTLLKCVASFNSACNSAGDGAGQIECAPGSVCLQVNCDAKGFGSCSKIADKFDPNEGCGNNSGSGTPASIGHAMAVTLALTLLQLLAY